MRGRLQPCRSSNVAVSMPEQRPRTSPGARSYSIDRHARISKSGAASVRLRRFSLQGGLLAYGVSTGVLALTIALFASAAATDPVNRFWWIAVCSIVVLGSLVALAGMWSAIAVYAAVFWCFHFGLIGSLATGYVSPSELPLGDESWVVGAFSGDAAILALAGLLAFASGASFVYGRRGFRRAGGGASRETERRAGTVHPYGVIGAVLVFGSVASWCIVVL